MKKKTQEKDERKKKKKVGRMKMERKENIGKQYETRQHGRKKKERREK